MRADELMEGARFTRLTVVKRLGSVKWGKKYRSLWLCKCDCGNFISVAGKNIANNNTKSCGCLSYESSVENGKKKKTHGLSSTKEYIAWRNAVKRVTDPENPKFPVYSNLGMFDEWLTNPVSFIEYIGKMPVVKGVRYTLGRINNLKGYFPGNVRWEVDVEQARNRGGYSNNKSGIQGVHLISPEGKSSKWVASWMSLDGKSRCRSFSVDKYGYEQAKQLATSVREEQMRLLQEAGAGYAEDHGLVCLSKLFGEKG